ncbi:MAG TPA: hypothetical protein VNA44_10125 [Burkholderiaceae bacterium]|nr:hypothetical protein [Burkholderiaceae bacterium]
MSLQEIEAAADALSRAEQEHLYKHLGAKLNGAPAANEKLASAAPAVVWPDFEARLKAIYDHSVMPSMVLAERESAPY